MSRDAEGGEMVQWTISRGERREHERAAPAGERSEALAEDEEMRPRIFRARLAFVCERSELTKTGALRAQRAVIPLCLESLTQGSPFWHKNRR